MELDNDSITDQEGNAAERFRSGGVPLERVRLRRLRRSWNPIHHVLLLLGLPGDVKRLRDVIRRLDIDVVLLTGLANPHGAIAAGQLATSSALVEPETRTTAGRALAILDVTDDMSGYNIPIGSAAQAAIYTHHWHHVSLIRKILLRMRSWQNYVFLEGH